MKCQKCFNDFEEKDLHDSHDVPTYLWEGNRKGRQNQADKLGRHWLCKDCHDKYESSLRKSLQTWSRMFAYEYFKEEKRDDNSTNSKQ